MPRHRCCAPISTPNTGKSRRAINPSFTNALWQIKIDTSVYGFSREQLNGLRIIRDWGLVRSEAPIFDVSRRDRRVSDLIAKYPVSTRRYVPLTIPGWKDPSFLESASLSEVTETNAIRNQITTRSPVVSEDAKAQTTSYTFNLGGEAEPYDQLEPRKLLITI